MTAPTLRERIEARVNGHSRNLAIIGKQCECESCALLREALAEMERLEQQKATEPGPFDNNWDLMP